MVSDKLIVPGALFINEDHNIFLVHDALHGHYIVKGGGKVNIQAKPTDILHPGFILTTGEVYFKYIGNLSTVLLALAKSYQEA